MKRINLVVLLVNLLIGTYVLAQAPEKMSYQAVVRNTTNNLVVNQNIGMQISILQGSSTAMPIYVEKQTLISNTNGLVTLEIGSGTVVTGIFENINWANGPYFIKTETDPTGGTSYTITGTSQLLSTAYALYAKTSGSSIPGPQGPQGLTGATGSTGSMGPQGLQGLTGPTGEKGANGLDGVIGPMGPQGLTGATGPTGEKGANGLDGSTGPMGPQGLTGGTGPAGEKGTNGLDGATGPMGPQGLTGATGSTGEKGATGPAGAKGANGLDGATGPMGLQGLTGPAGEKGANGLDGAIGAIGPMGPQGLTGVTGPAGAKGANGLDGATGPMGPQGLTGVTGPTGEKGANGLDGATGPMGPQGLTGAAGTNGTNGVGVPTGGTTGQILTKINTTDYSTQWVTPAISGGATLQLIAIKRLGNQTLANANGTNTGDLVTYDTVITTPTSGSYNSGTSTYTATATGLYYIQATTRAVDNTTPSNTINQYLYVDINNLGLNGITNALPAYSGASPQNFPSGSKGRGYVDTIAFLNAGDAVSIKGLAANSSTPGTTLKTDGSCRLMIVKLN
jgi:hypothetical protein